VLKLRTKLDTKIRPLDPFVSKTRNRGKLVSEAFQQFLAASQKGTSPSALPESGPIPRPQSIWELNNEGHECLSFMFSIQIPQIIRINLTSRINKKKIEHLRGKLRTGNSNAIVVQTLSALDPNDPIWFGGDLGAYLGHLERPY